MCMKIATKQHNVVLEIQPQPPHRRRDQTHVQTLQLHRGGPSTIYNRQFLQLREQGDHTRPHERLHIRRVEHESAHPTAIRKLPIQHKGTTKPKTTNIHRRNEGCDLFQHLNSERNQAHRELRQNKRTTRTKERNSQRRGIKMKIRTKFTPKEGNRE